MFSCCVVFTMLAERNHVLQSDSQLRIFILSIALLLIVLPPLLPQHPQLVIEVPCTLLY
jgi:hypothetical protein